MYTVSGRRFFRNVLTVIVLALTLYVGRPVLLRFLSSAQDPETRKMIEGKGGDQLIDAVARPLGVSVQTSVPPSTPPSAVTLPEAATTPANYTGVWIFFGCVIGAVVLVLALILVVKLRKAHHALTTARTNAKQAEIATGQLITRFPSDEEAEEQLCLSLVDKPVDYASYILDKLALLLVTVHEHQVEFAQLGLQESPPPRKGRLQYYQARAAVFQKLHATIEADAKAYGRLLEAPATAPKHVLSSQTSGMDTPLIRKFSNAGKAWLRR